MITESSEKCSNGKCCCMCHSAKAVLVILFGLTFLLGALGVISSGLVDVVWPVLVILGGLKLLGKSFCKCCSGSGTECCK